MRHKRSPLNRVGGKEGCEEKWEEEREAGERASHNSILVFTASQIFDVTNIGDSTIYYMDLKP